MGSNKRLGVKGSVEDSTRSRPHTHCDKMVGTEADVPSWKGSRSNNDTHISTEDVVRAKDSPPHSGIFAAFFKVEQW